MFSATDAAFSGFRTAREHPRAVLIWAIFLTVVSAVSTALMIVIGGPGLAELERLGGQTNPDPGQMMAAFGAVAPLFLLMIPVSLVYYGIVYSGASRMILQPSQGQRGFLALGADEFRQIGLLVLMTLLLTGVYIAVVIAGAVIGGITMVINQPFGVIVIVLVIFAGFAGMISLAVKLSLASPQTFERRKVSLFGAWRMSNGKFWPMLGAYLLAVILAMVVNLMVLVIFLVAIVLPLSGLEGIGAFMQPDTTSLGAYFTLPRLLFIPVGGLISALTWLIILCPAPTIYQQLAGKRDPEAALV